MVQSGTLLRVYADGVAIAKATNCTISYNGEMIQTTHKDNVGSWTEGTPGQKNGTVTCEALYAEGESFESLFNAFDTNTVVAIKYSTEVTGDKRTSVNTYITSMEKSAPVNDNVSYTVTFTMTSRPVRETV